MGPWPGLKIVSPQRLVVTFMREKSLIYSVSYCIQSLHTYRWPRLLDCGRGFFMEHGSRGCGELPQTLLRVFTYQNQ